MLKKLFQKRQPIQEGSADRVDVILRLMFEIAVSDGNIDNAELTILKKRAAQISAEGEKAVTPLAYTRGATTSGSKARSRNQ